MNAHEIRNNLKINYSMCVENGKFRQTPVLQIDVFFIQNNYSSVHRLFGSRFKNRSISKWLPLHKNVNSQTTLVFNNTSSFPIYTEIYHIKSEIKNA